MQVHVGQAHDRESEREKEGEAAAHNSDTQRTFCSLTKLLPLFVFFLSVLLRGSIITYAKNKNEILGHDIFVKLNLMT